MFEEKSQRRDFIKKAAYAVPMILTLKALPAFAAAGSGASRSSTKSRDSNKVDKETDQNQQPNGSSPGKPAVNDGPAAGPGASLTTAR